MSIYLHSEITPSEDGQSSRHVRADRIHADIGDGKAEEVALVDDPADGEKPLKSFTVPELAQKAKDLGVKPEIADHLKKPELIDVIERMTHTNDD